MDHETAAADVAHAGISNIARGAATETAFADVHADPDAFLRSVRASVDTGRSEKQQLGVAACAEVGGDLTRRARGLAQCANTSLFGVVWRTLVDAGVPQQVGEGSLEVAGNAGSWLALATEAVRTALFAEAVARIEHAIWTLVEAELGRLLDPQVVSFSTRQAPLLVIREPCVTAGCTHGIATTAFQIDSAVCGPSGITLRLTSREGAFLLESGECRVVEPAGRAVRLAVTTRTRHARREALQQRMDLQHVNRVLPVCIVVSR